MTSVLGYDSLNAISLNWYVFVGILIGSATVFYRQVVLRKGFKFLIYVGFLLILVYQYYMYFLIDPDLNIESFYLPNLLKGIGHGILYICLTIYIAKSVPFKHFFQGLCAQFYPYQCRDSFRYCYLEPFFEIHAARQYWFA